MSNCSTCGIEHDRKGQRLCVVCHAAYMRQWRKTHPLNLIQRIKDNCRSYAGVYLRRGKIEKKVCSRCSNEKSQMHHDDYKQPLKIDWLCRSCHLDLHKAGA